MIHLFPKKKGLGDSSPLCLCLPPLPPLHPSLFFALRSGQVSQLFWAGGDPCKVYIMLEYKTRVLLGSSSSLKITLPDCWDPSVLCEKEH